MVKWTKETPTEEGWYWARIRARIREINQVQIVYVFIGIHKLDEVTFITLHGYGSETHEKRADRVSDWFGPIVEPEGLNG